MRLKISLVLVAGLLLGAGPTTPTTSAPLAPKAERVIVSPEATTITISPGTKPINIRPVKTEEDSKIRLELPGVTIEAVCLRIKSEGSIFEMQITKDGRIQSQKYQDGQQGKTGSTPEPAPAIDQPRK